MAETLVLKKVPLEVPRTSGLKRQKKFNKYI